VRFRLPATLAVSIAVLATAAPAAASSRWIVTYEPSAGSVDAETNARERADGFEATHRFHRAVRGFSARLSSQQVAQLRADPEVAAVTPDRPVRATGDTLSAGETVPTGIKRVGASAGTSIRGAGTAAVAVIDTGIDLDHPDLDAHAGVDCTATGSSDDDEGHGTHVAGTIAARNAGSGVVGIAPGTSLYAVKVLDGQGSGYDSWVICGLDWIAQHATELNIKVANMSLGGSGVKSTCGSHADPLHEAVCRATAAGVTVVVAAGNDGRDFGQTPVDTPAWYPEVLTVTAVSDGDGAAGAAQAPGCMSSEQDDAFATFSNYAVLDADAAHTIAAPGVCILSTYTGGGHAIGSGTSMASPHVAGEVALCLGEDGSPGPCAGLTPSQIVSAMRADAANAASQGLGGFTGDPAHAYANRWYGYLGRAPAATVSVPPVAASPPPSPTVTPTVPASDPVAPPAPSRCKVVSVRVKRVHRKVRVVRRKGHASRRVVRHWTTWHRVKRFRCS
jgi:subtilisin